MHVTVGVLVLVLVGAVVVQSAVKLPPWITACYRDDPDFDACALRNGQACIARLVQGERKLELPVLEPLAITEMRIDSKATNLGLDVVLSNTTIHGLTETKILKFHVDFKKLHVSLSLSIPRAEILVTYDISGRILILPITGKGPGNITLEDVSLDYNVDFDLVQKHGKDHMNFKNDKMAFDATRAHIKLENLFNGDKRIGDTMNVFLNSNWRDLVAEVGPAISEALSTITTTIFQRLAVHVAYDDIVPLRQLT